MSFMLVEQKARMKAVARRAFVKRVTLKSMAALLIC